MKPVMPWRVDGPQGPREHMAADEALVYGGRVYTWDAPAVTLGRFQDPARVMAAHPHLPHAVRPTGGKAVLHGHDLTIGLAVPWEWANWSEAERRSVRLVYRRLAEPLVQALNQAGVAAALAEQTPFVRSAGKVADCFAHIAPNDIVDPKTGRKVCGCALALRESGVLVQCSLPVRLPAPEVANLFGAQVIYGQYPHLTAERLADALADAFGP